MIETVGRVTFGTITTGTITTEDIHKPKPQVVTHERTGRSEPHPPMLCECVDRKRKIHEAVAWIYCPWCGKRLK